MDEFNQEFAAFPGPGQSVHNNGDPLDEDEAGDDEDRVPVELRRAPVPAEPLPVMKDPDEGEEHGEEAEQQRRDQQHEEEPVALHVPSPARTPRPEGQALALIPFRRAAAPGGEEVGRGQREAHPPSLPRWMGGSQQFSKS